jgi:hypothetical protein
MYYLKNYNIIFLLYNVIIYSGILQPLKESVFNVFNLVIFVHDLIFSQ